MKGCLDSAFEKSKESRTQEVKEDWLDSKWEGFKSSKQLSMIRKTGVSADLLHRIGKPPSLPLARSPIDPPKYTSTSCTTHSLLLYGYCRGVDL